MMDMDFVCPLRMMGVIPVQQEHSNLNFSSKSNNTALVLVLGDWG